MTSDLIRLCLGIDLYLDARYSVLLTQCNAKLNEEFKSHATRHAMFLSLGRRLLARHEFFEDTRHKDCAQLAFAWDIMVAHFRCPKESLCMHSVEVADHKSKRLQLKEIHAFPHRGFQTVCEVGNRRSSDINRHAVIQSAGISDYMHIHTHTSRTSQPPCEWIRRPTRSSRIFFPEVRLPPATRKRKHDILRALNLSRIIGQT